MAYIELSADTVLIESPLTEVSPWAMAMADDATVVVSVEVDGEAGVDVRGLVLAVRANGRDVAATTATSLPMQLHARLHLVADDVVTCELRAVNASRVAATTVEVVEARIRVWAES